MEITIVATCQLVNSFLNFYISSYSKRVKCCLVLQGTGICGEPRLSKFWMDRVKLQLGPDLVSTVKSQLGSDLVSREQSQLGFRHFE